MQYTINFTFSLMTYRMLMRAIADDYRKEGAIVIDVDKIKEIDNAIEFARGKNKPFDVNVVKNIMTDYANGVIKFTVKKEGELVKKCVQMKIDESRKNEILECLKHLCNERLMTPLPTPLQPMPKVTAKEFLKLHYDRVSSILEQGAPIKKALVQFARKQGVLFDATTLLRAWNKIKPRRRK